VGRGFHGGYGHRFAFGSGLGYGFYPYDYYDDYSDYTYDPYAYYDDGGGCYVVQRRVHTSHGWRHQPVGRFGNKTEIRKVWQQIINSIENDLGQSRTHC